MSASEREPLYAPALDHVHDGDGGIAIWDPDWPGDRAWIQSDCWVRTEVIR